MFVELLCESHPRTQTSTDAHLILTCASTHAVSSQPLSHSHTDTHTKVKTERHLRRCTESTVLRDNFHYMPALVKLSEERKGFETVWMVLLWKALPFIFFFPYRKHKTFRKTAQAFILWRFKLLHSIHLRLRSESWCEILRNAPYFLWLYLYGKVYFSNFHFCKCVK